MTTVTNSARDRLLPLPNPEPQAPVNVEPLENQQMDFDGQGDGLVIAYDGLSQRLQEKIAMDSEEMDGFLEEMRKGQNAIDKDLRKLKGIYGVTSEIGFWTPVAYVQDVPLLSVEGLRQCVDGYFWLGRCKIAVVESLKYPDNVVLKRRRPEAWWKTALKIMSFVILFFPMLVAKYILRRGQPFFIQKERWLVASRARVCVSEGVRAARLERDKAIRTALFAYESVYELG